MAKQNCVYESSADGHQLQLKPKTRLHLYTNRLPKGAEKNFSFKYGYSRSLCFVDGDILQML